MHKIHQNLKLQHHRHTGKLLHRHHTSYRALAVVFVLAAGFMWGLNVASKAAAAELFSVGATVRAPVPSQAPEVTVPADGASVSSARTVVAGSCPFIDPQVVVRIAVDQQPAGSGICDSSNLFSVTVTLAAGPHEISAQSFTVDGTAGPASQALRVSSAVPPIQNAPALLTSKDALSFLGPSKTASWDGSLTDTTGGTLNIAWGDGERSSYDVQPGALHMNHHYSKLASHNVLITYTDAQHTILTRQFAVAAYRSPAPLLPATTTKPTASSATYGLYGLYLTVLSVCGIVWLLERRHIREAAAQHA
jgi:hypothetical protein